MQPQVILIVDDDLAISSLVEAILSDEGYRVVTAHNGAEALGVLEGCEPDLILLDMQMPDMNGWEFATKYRAPGRPEKPIVVMTAELNPRAKAADIQAAGCLAKPFDLEDLVSIVTEFAGPPQRDWTSSDSFAKT